MAKPKPDRLTNLVSNRVTPEAQSVRRTFYRKVLTSVPVEPRKDLQEICRAWLEATKADWVWLWLQHHEHHDRPWELTAAIGRSGKPEKHLPEKPSNVALEAKDSVAAYATQIERPLLVNDIENWKRKLNGITYRVICKDELLKRKCHSILSVPLIFSKLDSGEQISPYSSIGRIRGLICSHFLAKNPPQPVQDEDGYMLMGFATARVLAASFAAEQHRIRFELDSLATKYLTTFDQDALVARKDYLAEVIDLIKKHLRVSYVSVFYRVGGNEDQIECIATTGLRNETVTLPANRLYEARYKKGEHLTGKVFETGIPYISKIGETPTRPEGGRDYKWKERPDDVPESDHSWVCYPINSPAIVPGDPSSRSTLGVLRCFGNESLLAHRIARNFDPIQIQTLDFIARQIAPVLETMAAHIKRERQIAVIKHDLLNPIRMLDVGVENVIDCVLKAQLPLHWEANMKFSLAMAKNLTHVLGETRSFLQAEPTFLETTVIIPQMNGLRYYAQAEKNIRICFQSIRDVFPALNVDRELIGSVFFNLLVNAVKYGNRGSEIRIWGEETPLNYLIHVQNEGFGVDENEKDRIFYGEYRSPRVTQTLKGSGLGLKLSHDVMKRHGGDLLLTQLHQPTIFTILFPKRLAAKISRMGK